MTLRRAATAASLVVLMSLGACGSDDDPTTTTSTSTSSSTSAPSSTVAASPEFPPDLRDLEHGGAVWAVVLAAATSSEDPALEAAISAAADAGYDQAGVTDCDEGAAAARGAPDGSYTVSVYFETEADARAAVEAFAAREVEGVAAEVKTYCLD